MSARPRFFGHRGARALAPENTLASLHRAIADGADGLEFDVRATADGVLVLLHDATLDRTTNGRGPLAAKTAREVAALDAGVSFAPLPTPAGVPTLDEVLDEFEGRTVLDIELKEVLPREAARRLGRRLAKSAAVPPLTGIREAPVFVSSFLPEALDSFAAEAPHVPRGLLLDRLVPPPSAGEAARLGLALLVAHEASIDAPFAAACARLELPLHAYTVNDPARARALAALGVDILVTDDPKRLRDGFGGSSGGRESSRARV